MLYKMKPYYILAFGLCFSLLYAQDVCEKNIKKAQSLIQNPSPFTEQAAIFNLIEPCALQGNAEAENYLGMLYLKGIGTEKDDIKAFKYISKSAKKNYDKAQYNLGRLYKYGSGCQLNFQKAMDWFETATANGNQRAAYSLGYMYYKGYGVEQNYTKAVYWFKRSEDPMAVHYLGLCYYLGYGVRANEDKALELLLNNPILNSKTLVDYIEKAQKETLKTKIEDDLQTTSAASNPINAEVVVETQNELKYEPYETLIFDDIKGAWSGKLVQYDWSGKHIQRILPIDIAIGINTITGAPQMTSTFEGQTLSSKAVWRDETLYLENPSDAVRLTKLFSSDPRQLTLDYNLFSIRLQIYEEQGVTYLLGALDSFIPEWTEYGEPMSLVLKPEGTVSEIDEKVLLALAAQEDQFIKLYPVPFNTQLTLQYHLETAANVFVELISLNGNDQIIIEPPTWQVAGDYNYSIPTTSSLPEGLYVVRIQAGNQLYTRMIIKNN